MKLDDLIEEYGSQAKVARALGITRGTVASWKKWNFVPYYIQLRVQMMTSGKLKARYYGDNQTRSGMPRYSKNNIEVKKDSNDEQFEINN